MAHRYSALFPGLILILVGLWFLARNLNLGLPGLGQLWPGLIALGGLAALADFAAGRKRDPDQVFLGIAALGLSAFFFLFTLNVWLPGFGPVTWAAMGRLWPGFVLIAGAAFLGQWLASLLKDMGTLFAGLVCTAFGGIALGATFGLLRPDQVRLAQQYWPLALVILGLGLLIDSLVRRRR